MKATVAQMSGFQTDGSGCEAFAYGSNTVTLILKNFLSNAVDEGTQGSGNAMDKDSGNVMDKVQGMLQMKELK